MLRIIYLFLLLLYAESLLAQTSIIIKDPKREIKFIDLSMEENASYFRHNLEVPRLIIDAMNGSRNIKVDVCLIDYSKNAEVKPISHDDFLKRISYSEELFIQDYDFTDTLSSEVALVKSTIQNWVYLFPSDFKVIGLDMTSGTVNGKNYSQIHYINFYIKEDLAKKTGKDPYMFSISWDTFIKVLESYNWLLYTTNAKGCWWKGNVLLTNNKYSFDVEIANNFLKIWEKERLQAKDWKDRRIIDLSSFNKKLTYDIDFFIRETNDNGYYNLSELIGETVVDWNDYSKSERIVMNWNDFKQTKNYTNWNKNAELYLLPEAIRMEKWKYSDKPYQTISINGKFQDLKKDSLCTSNITPSFDINHPTILNKFKLDIQEGLFLFDTLNAHLHIPGHSLVEIIHENILKGNLSTYANDSLNRKLTIEEFIKYASLVINSERFYGFGKKGDTIEYEGQSGISQYYVLTKDVSQSQFINSKYLDWMTPLELPLYQPLQLNVIDVLYTMNFDKEGLHKTYTPKAITLYIPHNINIRGIQLSICTVSWQELKNILLKDTRAIISYKGKNVTLAKIIEERIFFQYFAKTGFIELNR
jgi:hypothetical protein